MKTVAVSKLKASLSEYLSRVIRGEDIVITDRGRPVAKMTALDPGEAEIDAALLTMERAGIVRIGRSLLPAKFWKMKRPVDKTGAALRGLIEERRNGR